MNKSNKTTKKRITKPITWPNVPYFTIEQLQKSNKSIVEITLRVKLNKEIEEGRAVFIGQIMGNAGRPKKVFAVTPVTQKVLDTANHDGIMLSEKAHLLVKAVQVSHGTSDTSISPGMSSSVKTAEPVKCT